MSAKHYASLEVDLCGKILFVDAAVIYDEGMPDYYRPGIHGTATLVAGCEPMARCVKVEGVRDWNGEDLDPSEADMAAIRDQVLEFWKDDPCKCD